MKKALIYVILLLFSASQSLPAEIALNFEEVKANRAPQAEAKTDAPANRSLEVPADPSGSFLSKGPLQTDSSADDTSKQNAQFLPEVNDEVLVVFVMKRIQERLEAAHKGILDSCSNLGPEPTKACEDYVATSNALIDKDLRQITIGVGDVAVKLDSPGDARALLQQWSIYIDDIIIGVTDVMEKYLKALNGADTDQDIQNALKTAQSNLNSLLAEVPTLGQQFIDSVRSHFGDTIAKEMQAHVSFYQDRIANEAFKTASQAADKIAPFVIPEVDDEVLVGFFMDRISDIFAFFNNYRPQFSEQEAEALDGVLFTVGAELEEIENAFFDIWIGVFDDTSGSESIQLRQTSRMVGITIWDYERQVRELLKGLLEDAGVGNGITRSASADPLETFIKALEALTEDLKTDVQAIFDARPGKGITAERKEAFMATIDGLHQVITNGAMDIDLSLSTILAVFREVDGMNAAIEDAASNFKGTDEELQAFLADAKELQKDYLGFVYEVFRDIRFQFSIAESPEEFDTAVQENESRLFKLNKEVLNLYEELFGNYNIKDGSLTAVKGALVQINVIALDWLADFEETWAKCISPLCGGAF